MVLSAREDGLFGGSGRTTCLKTHEVRIDLQGQDCLVGGLSWLVKWSLGPVHLVPAA